MNVAKTGLYAKALLHWNKKNPADKCIWKNFKDHMISEYEHMPVKTGGTTFGQEGYSAAYNATKTAKDTAYLTESLVQYAERATVAESKVSSLEGRLEVQELDGQRA